MLYYISLLYFTFSISFYWYLSLISHFIYILLHITLYIYILYKDSNSYFYLILKVNQLKKTFLDQITPKIVY